MIPLTLVTGFLGSGKTTLLRRIIAADRDRRYVYLVNEFSSQDVDGRVLSCAEDRLVAVAGGSIFCRCLVTEFIGHMRTIAERSNTGERRIDGLIIEASGIADPRVISRMLEETGLAEHYRLATVVSVVDPGSFIGLLETLPNVGAQVQASTTVLLNKTDLCSPAQIEETERTVRSLNPHARVVRTRWCDTDVDLCGPAPTQTLQGDYALCADPNYVVIGVPLSGPIDVGALWDRIAASSHAVFRLKGFAPTEDGVVYLDVSLAGREVCPAPDHELPAELTLIGPSTAREDLRRLADDIRSDGSARPTCRPGSVPTKR